MLTPFGAARQESLLGPDHPDVARTLTNLGNARAMLGAYGPATEALDRARSIKESYYGPDHVCTPVVGVCQSVHASSPPSLHPPPFPP